MKNAIFLQNITLTDLNSCDNADSFLQSGFWGTFKAHFGWKAKGFLTDWGDYGKGPLLLIYRSLAPGISFAYIPFGPELPEHFPVGSIERSTALGECAEALRSFLPASTAFIRFDPPWYTTFDSEPPHLEKPFSHAGADVQPAHTVLIDLQPDEESILQLMKAKWRYNIGLAHKKGVIIRRTDASGVDHFYDLLHETAQRDGISVHGIDYYRGLFTIDYAGKKPDLRLYEAEYQGQPLSAIVTLFHGHSATYLYGASSNLNRNVMAPHALQWQAMQDAKAAGCTVYDLFGIAPNPDPNHPMAGLYFFKTGFGGTIIHRAGSWDYAYRPLLKHLFEKAEGIRKFVWKFRKHSH
ncbi:peptidoglycan bridge formation protein FemAB [Spirochaetia bacterium]|nr:peptidoglycan bridge formation protein FemAB [Spirochaetia bacterium]GHU34968.1 peptidoglycan bridge formation protein FemAB [Spirochaetia bacterium]